MNERAFPRTAVLGAGAVGGYVGGMIARHGIPVSLLCRAGQKDAILESGLVLDGPSGRHVVHAGDLDAAGAEGGPALSVTIQPERAVRAAKLVFVCVKSQDTEALLAPLSETLVKDATVVLLQNGVRNEETAKRLLPGRLCVEAVVLFNALYLEPGKVTLTATESIILDSELENLPPAQAAVELLGKAGISVRFKRNVRGVLWTKLIINLNNGISALTGATLFEGLRNPQVRYLGRRLMAEGMQVLQKAGIALEPMPAVDPARLMWLLRMPGPLAVFIMKRIIHPYQDVQSSTWQSRVRGKPTEIAFLSGEIVRLAKEHRTQAPLNEKVLQLVQEVEKKKGLRTYSPKELITLLGA